MADLNDLLEADIKRQNCESYDRERYAIPRKIFPKIQKFRTDPALAKNNLFVKRGPFLSG